MVGTYHLELVLLSLAIAVIASYSALDLGGRVRSARSWLRALWLVGGAIAMGSGIWSMHFVAMLAFQLPVAVQYDVTLTLGSLGVAVLASGFGLVLLARSRLDWLVLGGGSLSMGLAIAAMHYLGMAAMGPSVRLTYNAGLVGLSVAIAIGASGAALGLAFQLRQQTEQRLIWYKLGSALVMGVAISGMHYTGMLATCFLAQPGPLPSSSPALAPSLLAVGVGAASLFLLALTLVTSLFEQRLAAQRRREQTLVESENRFRQLIREMQVGVLVLSVTGEIVVCNQAVERLLDLDLSDPGGRSFQALVSPVWQLLHEDETPFLPEEWPMARAIATGEPVRDVVMGLAPIQGGDRRWLLVQTDPHWDAEGSLERLVCTLSDITGEKQAQVALRQSEERFALALEGVNDGIWDWNLSTGEVYYSPRWQQMLGYDTIELDPSFESFLQLLHPEDREVISARIAAYFARQLPIYEVEFRAAHRDGSYRWILARGAALWDEQGVPYRMVGSHTDITDRKQAEAALCQLIEKERTVARIVQRMSQSLEPAVIFRSMTEELRSALQCDRVLVGRCEPEGSGQIEAEAIAPESPWPPLSRGAIAAGPDFSALSRFLLESPGTPAIATLSLAVALPPSCCLIVPILSRGQPWGLLIAAEFRGDRRWQETEISLTTQISNQLGVAIQQAELFAKTQQQSIEVQLAKEAADSANRAKSEFLANMSHELRTPLNAILGFTQLLHRDRSLSASHREYVEVISRSGASLLDLINDILEMSKIEAGRVVLNEDNFDLYHLLETLEVLLSVKAQAKGLDLRIERSPQVPQYIKADETKLRQVLTNLLGNAIKFTQRGKVVLRLRPEKAAAHPGEILWPGKMLLRFEVQDTGPGIALHEQEYLFDAFNQTALGMKSGEGTGLGLPISQRFVQLMGGKISLESEIGQGALFSFVIPVLLADESLVVPLRSPQRRVLALAPDQPPTRILVVEDHPKSRLLLTRMLTAVGFEVQEAEDGQEAIAAWQAWHPHLILMDMRMPVMNGYEATARIKASPGGDRVPIVALTANAFEEEHQQARDSGCNDFIRKPFSEEELFDKLRASLNLQYVYEDDVQSPEEEAIADTALLISQLRTMPETWCQQIYYAARQGSDLLILKLIEEMPDSLETLEKALSTWVNDFRFDQIADLIHSAFPEANG